MFLPRCQNSDLKWFTQPLQNFNSMRSDPKIDPILPILSDNLHSFSPSNLIWGQFFMQDLGMNQSLVHVENQSHFVFTDFR